MNIHGCLVGQCGSPATLWGTATYGLARPDVATSLGHARYTNSGYSFQMADLPPGTYQVEIWVHETVTSGWYMSSRTITVTGSPVHVLETPTNGQGVASPVTVSGWAIDTSAPVGPGVDVVHVWTYPDVGTGTAPEFVNAASYGGNRAGVAATFGEPYRYSGYTLSAALDPGIHLLAVSSRSTHTHAWTTRTAMAYVDIPTSPLTITRGGSGTGGITATGLSCAGGSSTQGVPCEASYALGTTVSLTAVPDSGSTFAGWVGACSGAGTCAVTVNGPRHVTAIFSKTPDTIETHYYHTDVIGSVRAITDATGAVVTRHDYMPYGEDTMPMTGDPMRFAGKELDPETGMQNFEARYYRQTWGRFTQVDPLHVTEAMVDPQQWNRYAYARNNPLRFQDPTGLSVSVRASVDWWYGRSFDADSLTMNSEYGSLMFDSEMEFESWLMQRGMMRAPGGQIEHKVYGVVGSYEIIWTALEHETPAVPLDADDTLQNEQGGGGGWVTPGSRGVPSDIRECFGTRRGTRVIDEACARAYFEGNPDHLKLGMVPVSPGQYAAMAREAAKGVRFLVRSISRYEKRIAEHVKKISDARSLGGHTSSMEREVRNWQALVAAGKDILRNMRGR